MAITFRLLQRQISDMFRIRIVLALLIGIIFSCVTAQHYLQYSLIIGESVNCIEPFVIIGNIREYMIIPFIGYMVLISDAPFITNRTILSVLRSSRKTWITSNIFYIIIACFIYYAAIVFSTMAMVSPNAYLGNVWSDPLYRLTLMRGAQAQNIYSVYFPYAYMLKEFTPLLTFVHTFALNILYCILSGLLVYIININTRQGLGTLVVMGIYLVSYVVVSEGLLGNQNISFLVHSMPAYHRFGIVNSTSPLIAHSYLLFFFLIVSLIIVALALCKFCDFKTAVEEKE